MLCDQVRDHLSAYLDKELTAELSDTVRAHLDTCAACRTLAGELQATADLLGRLPVRSAPEHLAADVIGEIERRGIVPAGAPVEGQPQERTLPMRRARLWPRALAVAAAVLLTVGIGVLAYLSETSKGPAPTRAYEVAALPAKDAAAPGQVQLADRGVVLGSGDARKAGLGAAPSANIAGETVTTGGVAIVRNGDALRRLGGNGPGTTGMATVNGGTLALKIAPDGAKMGEVAAGPTLPLGTDVAGAVVGQQAKVPPPAQTTWALTHGEPASKTGDDAMRMAKALPAEPATETSAPAAVAPPATPAQAQTQWGKSVVEKPAVAAQPAAPVRPGSRTDLRPSAATTDSAVRPSEEAIKVTPAGPTVVAKMMADVANGRIAADQLARVATRDNLQAADNQLILRADSPDEADRRLVQLFRANGWWSLAPTGERERSVSRAGVSQDERGEPGKPPAAGSAGAGPLPPPEKGQPTAGPGAPGGVYWQASRNGAQVWLVLADRDSLSRFGSRLAQVEGIDVDGDSSPEFRAIARLQQQWKESLGRHAVAADTEGLNTEARSGEAARGSQPASKLSSKAATDKAGGDTTYDGPARRVKDAKQEAAGAFAWRGSAPAPAATPGVPAPAEEDNGQSGRQSGSGGGTAGAAPATAAQRPPAAQPGGGAYNGTLEEGRVADALRAPGAPQAAAKMKAAGNKTDAAETMDFFDTVAARNAQAPPANAVLLVIRVQPSGAQRAAKEAAAEAPAAAPASESGGKTTP
jgi:anti-sigma factor (TIGR02949 family)